MTAHQHLSTGGRRNRKEQSRGKNGRGLPARRWRLLRQHSVGSESLECFANSSRQLHPGGAIWMVNADGVDVNLHND